MHGNLDVDSAKKCVMHGFLFVTLRNKIAQSAQDILAKISIITAAGFLTRMSGWICCVDIQEKTNDLWVDIKTCICIDLQ